MPHLFELLRRLENPIVPDNLVSQIKSDHSNDIHMVQTYFISRIREGISFQSVLNIMTHSERSKDLLSIDGQLNEVIVWQYFKKEHPEYLINLIDKDPRSKRPLKFDLASYMSELTITEINMAVSDIAGSTNIEERDLYYLIINSYWQDHIRSGVREQMLVDSLTLKIKYSLLCDAIKTGHWIFPKIRDHIENKYFYKFIQDRLSDNSELCMAIRQAPFSISFMCHPTFQKCLFEKYLQIPNTIQYIFEKAIEQSDAILLSSMGGVYNKKEVLRALVLIAETTGQIKPMDEFIIKYKTSNEIKNLIPFI